MESSSIYAKSECAVETNIFEQKLADISALSNHIWFGFSHKRQSRRQQLYINLMSNLSLYNKYQTENKAINMLVLNHNYTLRNRVTFQSDIRIFNKQWYNDNSGYTTSLFSSSIGGSHSKIKALAGFEYQYNNFPSIPIFTSDQTGLFFQFYHNSSSKKTTSARISYHVIRYSERTIYRSSSADSLNLPLQKDNMLFIQLGREFRKKALGGIYLRYMILHSNSDFSSFQSASIRFFNTRRIAGFYVQLIAEYQFKQYSEENAKLFTFSNPDPEQNIQNQLLVGWERPITKN
ncbi:MAG: hypothetical protein KAU06_09890, partial [Candidatus Marinimicrobia bacterium]|nr:hypothetical protein [Candidatus Neomarinimicrobiota bacterium]